jgi:urease accessory protein
MADLLSPPRALGAVALSARAAEGAMRLGRLRQEGCLKALFPRAGGPWLEAVTLNTAGGLTGGDRLALSAGAGEGARLLLTTQAAERAYRAASGTALVEARLDVAPGGRIDWLPQETILFDGANLDRRLHLDLAGDARALVVEPVILGRLARGERLTAARFRDRWEVRRDGRLLLLEAQRLEGDVHALMDRAAIGGGARAYATLLYAGPDAEARLRPLRALLPPEAGASCPTEGLLIARLLAPDGFALRAALIPLITSLTGSPLPKVWRL